MQMKYWFCDNEDDDMSELENSRWQGNHIELLWEIGTL